MKYSLKTGRLKFEAADRKFIKARPQKTRRLIRFPSLILKRPVSNEKTIDSLNKQLGRHIIKFNKKNEKNSIIRLLTANEAFKMAKRTAVYAAAFCVMLVLVYGSVASMNLTFAKQVIANGTPVGLITNVDEFEKNVTALEEQIKTVSNGEFSEKAKLVYITRLCFEKDITSKEDILQNVMGTYDATTLGYSLYVDNNLVCAAKSNDEIKAVLNEYKKQFDVDVPGAIVEFNQKVDMVKEYVPIAYLCSADGILKSITKTREAEVEYVVKNNDTMWDIAMSHNMSVDEIMEFNPEMTDLIKEGDVLKLSKSEPILQVKVSYTETVEKAIPHDNEKVNDSSLRKGLTKVVVQGTDGKKAVTQEVVMLNGKKVAVNVIKENVLEEAVSGKIKVGTKIVSGVGSGRFSRPTYGTITARYGSGGSRWSSGRHTGLDFAAPTGTPITAADSGRVTFAGWKGSYGYMVILNHGNGYETYYAHCSRLLVSVGETVTKGEVIAKVGNTGNSTGSHCHFEVIYNGVSKNPENYLK